MQNPKDYVNSTLAQFNSFRIDGRLSEPEIRDKRGFKQGSIFFNLDESSGESLEIKSQKKLEPEPEPAYEPPPEPAPVVGSNSWALNRASFLALGLVVWSSFGFESNGPFKETKMILCLTMSSCLTLRRRSSNYQSPCSLLCRLARGKLPTTIDATNSASSSSHLRFYYVSARQFLSGLVVILFYLICYVHHLYCECPKSVLKRDLADIDLRNPKSSP